MNERRVVFYVGAHQLDSAAFDEFELAAGGLQYEMVDDRSVFPLDLYPLLDRTALLVILDPMSFPFESMHAGDWDVPMTVVLPDMAADEVVYLFDGALLAKLTLFDDVIASSEEVLSRLQTRYQLAASQLVELKGIGDVVRHAIGRVAGPAIDPSTLIKEEYESEAYWSERGALADGDQVRAIMSIRHDLRANKAQHRVQAEALEPVIRKAMDALPGSRLMAEMGCGVGRWASLAGPGTQFLGYDISPGMIEQAGRNFPQHDWRQLGPQFRLAVPPGSVDLFFTVTVLHHNPKETRLRLIEAMFEALRPGGRLVFLEDMVALSNPQSTVYEMGIKTFISEILDATRHRVVMEHFETVRYSHVELVRTGLLVLSKMGPA